MDIKPYAKAAIGALVAGLTSLVAALPDGLTAAEWLTAVIAALTVGGGVYAVPNKVPPATTTLKLDGKAINTMLLKNKRNDLGVLEMGFVIGLLFAAFLILAILWLVGVHVHVR